MADDNSFFYRARHERRPVVLGVPYDLQKEPSPNIGRYRRSTDVLPRIERIPPHPQHTPPGESRRRTGRHNLNMRVKRGRQNPLRGPAINA
jgi:hypothetical protein